jgi:tripartite-type tricarboxylate transporter receptor subunit TctC
MKRRTALKFAALLSATGPAFAQAKPWPAKPVRIIVTFAPGGPLDSLARIVAAQWSPLIGQPIVIENRPGAGSIIGVNALAKSDGDGHTLMVDGGAAVTTLPSVATLPFDPERDLVGVASIAQSPTVFVINAALPFKNLREFIDHAKANPGKLTVGLSAPGSLRQFVVDLLRRDAGINILDVPYKGSAPAMNALLGGEVSMFPSDVAAALPYLKTGKLRCLATLGPNRFPDLPDVPTAVEQGFPNLIAMNYYGLFAPGTTPPALVDAINTSLRKALDGSELKAQMRSMNLQIASGSAADYQTLLRSERTKWSPVGKASGMRLN